MFFNKKSVRFFKNYVGLVLFFCSSYYAQDTNALSGMTNVDEQVIPLQSTTNKCNNFHRTGSQKMGDKTEFSTLPISFFGLYF